VSWHSGGPPKLVLLGLGHANVQVLERIAGGRFPPAEVTLVTPEEEYLYSGMLPAVLAGDEPVASAVLRPARLAAAAGVKHLADRAFRINTGRRMVHLAEGPPLFYDLLSVDIGGAMAGDHLPGVLTHTLPLRPLRRAVALGERAALLAEASSQKEPVRITIAGGGAGGVEVALTLDGGLRARPAAARRYAITLVEAGADLLPEHPPRARRLVEKLLAERGIRVRAGVQVVAAERGRLHTATGGEIGHDLGLWATGSRAPDLPARSGLPTDDAGYLKVDRTLRITRHPEIFAAGDCAVLEGRPRLPRAGVFAVRQGGVLADNLAAHLSGEALRGYRPQRRWLSLLNTGDRRALLLYGGHVRHGRPEWWLKRWLDLRWVRRFQRLEDSA
jgi:NADH dehydrogenase FAD-containing subunit